MKTPNPIETRRWTRQEYDRMIGAALFNPEERVELVDGEILRMVPQSSLHAAGVRAVEEALRKVFGAGYDVRVQLPLALGADSEPEPDVAVVTGSWRDYSDSHPETALLVVEVSDSTLEYDRERKGSLYARAGIAEYWILNVPAEILEVYRTDREPLQLSRSETISPLALPDARIAVADLLP